MYVCSTGFGISLAAAQAEAMPSVLPSDLKAAAEALELSSSSSSSHSDKNVNDNDNTTNDGSLLRPRALTTQEVVVKKSQQVFAKFNASRLSSLCRMVVKYFTVILVGAFIMYLNHHERRKQVNSLDEPFTFTDAMFFATVIATTVG
jgi:hypothetical protein